jgi:hypothetical protein
MNPKELENDQLTYLKKKIVELNTELKLLIQKRKDITITYSQKIRNTDNNNLKCNYRLLKIKELEVLQLEKDKKKHEIELLKIEIAFIIDKL